MNEDINLSNVKINGKLINQKNLTKKKDIKI